MPIYTIGHSTRTIEEFLALLVAHGVQCVVDVRTVPRSRRNPQFNRETLPGALAAAGIDYRHEKDLGGLRHAHKDSTNTGWRNASFRGFADHMQTPEFRAALDRLVEQGSTETVAVMCAEAVPWRCHRSLIADALLARGIVAEHIMSATRRDRHSLIPFAVVNGLTVTYPAVTDSSSGARELHLE
jgi:uncharacterized protein (DUF488 family)